MNKYRKGLEEHIDIILTSLADYKRWFDKKDKEDKDTIKSIEKAEDWLMSLNFKDDFLRRQLKNDF